MTIQHHATMSTDALRQGYDTVAETYAAHFPDANSEDALDLAMIQEFAKNAMRAPDGKILDAGCGSGRMTRHLSDLGCQVDGVDLSQAMLTVAQTNNTDLRFSVAPLDALPYPDGHFTGMLLWYSIIHTPAQRLAPIFDEAVRVLKPGGHILVGFQSGEGTRDLAAVFARFGHEVALERYRHTIAHVSELAEAAGFSVRARLLRSAEEPDKDDAAVVLAQLT